MCHFSIITLLYFKKGMIINLRYLYYFKNLVIFMNSSDYEHATTYLKVTHGNSRTFEISKPMWSRICYIYSKINQYIQYKQERKGIVHCMAKNIQFIYKMYKTFVHNLNFPSSFSWNIEWVDIRKIQKLSWEFLGT